ncbi:hypothetical protein [Aeromicrobium sp. UC242_57]|uniref:hypothetical protein n=1 Tax=Aeromicrobium sp. UC242_57 TaxID=3374624 RepID=UPI0037BAED6A
MSNLLYRLGRSAAARPWVAIGAWVVLALVVVASSAAFGRELDESFEAPGLDSYQAARCSTRPRQTRAGSLLTSSSKHGTLPRSWPRWRPLSQASHTY